jgi:phenylacetate-CoA ligase
LTDYHRRPVPADARQLERLRRQVQYLCERSPFYRDKFRVAGVGVGSLERLESLARFPFTTKEEVRASQTQAPPLGRHACVQMGDIVRVHSSTGTTGAPLWVGLTAHDVGVWTSITAAVLTTEGLERDDVLIHGAGLTTFVGGLPFKDAAERIGAAFVPIGTGASERALQAAVSLGATAIHSTPSYALYLAEYARTKTDLDPAGLGIRKVMCGGEPGAGEDALRARISRDWGGARVTEGMGNADMAPAVFAECPHGAGMHFVADEWVLPELIDPESGEPIGWDDGAEGELVYTALERECCPLLRFRTRDRIRVVGVGCACGRRGPRIRCIGRTDDMLIVLGVNVFPSAVRDVVAEHAATTGAVRIVLRQPGPKVEPPLEVEVEHVREASDAEQLRDELERAIRARLTISATVRLHPPGTLPRSEMKTALVTVQPDA